MLPTSRNTVHGADSSASGAPRPTKVFPTTRWTIISNLGNGEQRLRFIAWDDFCRSYQRPLQLWLYLRTRDQQLAEELVQSFFAKLHLKDHVMDALNPSKGQLRSWLLSCLHRHWIDEWRSRAPATEPIPADALAYSGPSDEIYDREWAFSLSRRVLSGLRDEYQARGKSPLYEAMLQALDNPGDANRSALCREMGMSDNHFSVAFMRFRERLAVRLRGEVAATVFGNDPAEIDAELRHLIAILSRMGGLTSATIGNDKP